VIQALIFRSSFVYERHQRQRTRKITLSTRRSFFVMACRCRHSKERILKVIEESEAENRSNSPGLHSRILGVNRKKRTSGCGVEPGYVLLPAVDGGDVKPVT